MSAMVLPSRTLLANLPRSRFAPVWGGLWGPLGPLLPPSGSCESMGEGRRRVLCLPRGSRIHPTTVSS
jgi:hypothetical protein